MNEMDEWGRDPSVRSVRDMFSRMEAAQGRLLEQLNLSPFDGRLRGARDAAKHLFERSRAHANARHVNMEGHQVAQLYVYCLASALGAWGIRVPDELLPKEEHFRALIREVIP